jgi:WXG100 family type VII secretion target
MEGIIRVSTEQLGSTAGTFEQQAVQIRTLTGQMMSKVTALSSFWEGDAGSLYIARFRGLEDDIERMVRMVQEHCSDLREMAGIYAAADAQNMDDAAALPEDVIS